MKSTSLNVCLLPLQIIWEDKDKNLINLEDKLRNCHPYTDLVIVPETFSTGFPSSKDKEYVRKFAEKNTSQTIDRIKELAAKFNVAIAGSFIADSGGLLFNRAFFIEPSGDEYFYDKRHLFSFAGEDKIFSRGRENLIVRYRGWNIAMVICYDIRFPAWCRNVDKKYDLLIAVANWPVARIDAWNKLLFARAIENQAYVCGVNCSGIDSNGYEYDGSSMAIDFKGKDITVSLNDDKGILYASLSKEKLEAFRNKFPAWNDADDFRIINH